MSDKNLYLNEFANEKSFLDLMREQKDKDDAIKSVKDLHDMKAADRVRKSHDTKSSIAKYTSLFRMNLKTIRTEGRIGKKGPQTAYTLAAKNSAYRSRLSRDKAELASLKTKTGNTHLTLLDLRLQRTHEKLRYGNNEAYKIARGNAPEAEGLDAWIPHEAKQEGENWTVSPEHVQENQTFVHNFHSDGEEKASMVQGFIEEVLSYNFSESMLNEEWLCENTDNFFRMIRRTLSLNKLVLGNYNQYKDIPEDVRSLLRAKINQAQALMGVVSKNAASRGIEASADYYIIKNKPNAEQINELIKSTNTNESIKAGRYKTYHEFFLHEKKTELELADKISGKSSEKAKTSVQGLSYEDFASMIGEKNRGQIEMSESGLHIINNGYFSRSKGKPSELNRLIRERFAEVVIAHLGEEDGEYYRPQLISLLELHDKQNRSALPLSRELISRIISETGAYHSAVERTLTKTASAPESPIRLYAQKVAGILGANPTTPNDYRNRKNQITGILRHAAALGMDGGDLSDHQMGVIINGNLNTIRDNIFRKLTTLDNRVLNLSGGNDFNVQEKIFNNNEFLIKLAAAEIRKVAYHATDDDDRYDAEAEKMIYDKAFEIAEKQDLKNEFENIYIGDLSLEGSSDLFEMLSDRLRAAGQVMTPDMKKQADAFSVFCDHLHRISEVNRQWLDRGSEADYLWTDELEELGKLVDGALANKDAFSLIMPYLEGTRFASGLTAARQKADSGYRFASSGKELSQKLNAKKLMRQEVPQEAPPIPVRSLTLSAEDEATYNTFTEGQRTIADILLLKKEPSSLIVTNEDDISRRISFLRDVFKVYGTNHPFITTIELAGETMRLSRSSRGIMTLSCGNKKMNIPANPVRIADFIDKDMADHIEKYGSKEIEKIYRINESEKSGREEVQKKNMAQRTLSRLTGQKASFFRNIEASKLKTYIYSILESENRQAKIDEIVAEIRAINSSTIFTEEETHTLVKKIKIEKDLAEVIMPREKERPAAKKGEPVWNSKEQKVVNLIADIVFSLETWDADNEIENLKDAKNKDKRGTRLMGALSNNLGALMLISNDEALLDKTMDKMSFPDMKAAGGGEDYKKLIAHEIKKFILDDEEFKQLRKEYPVTDKMAEQDDLVKGMVGKQYVDLLQKKKDNGSIEQVEKRIDSHVKKIIESMQSELTSIADAMFKEENAQPANQEALEDPYAKGIDRAEQVRRIEKRTAVLNRMMEEESREGSMQADFTKTILKNYFKDSSPMDQRSMVASMFRYCVPKKDMEDMPEDQIKIEKERLKGNTLGGFLKGAGPLLQKIMQGLPDTGMSEAMKFAIADTRSNLQPIPEKGILRRLNSLVDRSGGEIVQIEYIKSLGAASVGQAILCKIFGPNLPKEGKEVVVKLLRAEARNRMEREKSIILGYADQVDKDGGMRKTYEGQLNRIEDEFDLTLEEANIKSGCVYDEGSINVTAMKTNDLIQGTTTALILEKAKGSTIDSYMKETDSVRDEILADFYQYDDHGKLITDPDSGRPILAQKPGMSEKTGIAKRKLEEAYVHLLKRQQHLVTVADKWVTEAVFKSGFYHGDLHAGNIMADDDGATIIDFGNAVKLTKDQQIQLTRLTAAAAVGRADDFLEAFRALLENDESRQKFDQEKPTLLTRIREIFAIGTKESSGQMISLAIMRAQKLGIGIPASIQSFSQSQIRLANTIESVNSMIYSIRADLAALEEMPVDEPLFDICAMSDRESTQIGGGKDAALGKYRELIAPHANENDATPQQKEFKDKLISIFETKDKDTRDRLEKELSYYFEDTDNYGAQMKDAYDAYHIALEMNDTDQAAKVMDIFFKYYFQAVDRRLFASIERRAAGDRKIDDFYDVMTGVLNTNLRASLNRVGFFRSFGYERDLKKKSALEPDARQIARDDHEAQERKRLNEVREQTRLNMPAEMPNAFSVLSQKRTWNVTIQKRTDTLSKEIEDDRKYVISENLGQVWSDIRSRHIDAEGYEWLTPDEQVQMKANNGKLPTASVWKSMLDLICKTMAKDIQAIESQTDIVKRYEMEKKYYHFFVELPEKNGGEEFFMGLMSGDLDVGGKFGDSQKGKKDGLTSYNLSSDPENPVNMSIIRVLNIMSGPGRKNKTEPRRYIAKLMMLYGKQMTKGFKVREKPAIQERNERIREERMINDATRNKEDNAEFFITWHTKAKGEKPTLDKKYQGEEGRAAFLKHMTTTNFWRIDGDEKILGEFYDLATTCVTGYMKPIILSYLHFLLDGENPVAKSHYNRDRMLTTMHDLIQQCCIKDSNGNSCITDGKRAASFQLDLTAQRGKVRGDLALFRILYNPRKETKYISHSEKMFVERAQKNGWPKADSSVLENIASIVYEDYDLLTELDPESDKEQYDSYLNDINALELVIKDIEENELTSSQQRRDFFDRIIKIYGDRDRIGFNYYPKKRFEDARERLLTEEEVKNLKSAEKDN